MAFSQRLLSRRQFVPFTQNTVRSLKGYSRAQRNACRASAAVEARPSTAPPATNAPIKVRFAPSPTGNLHVGGARTALFNWLFAKRMGGKFVLRVEDTDQARSTKESEDAMVRDLKWLGLEWDEGPDVGGPNGPYRQSERTEIYKQYVDKLVAAGVAYPCFCTDQEIDLMKKDAEEKKLPPIYRGKWASASKEEVDAAFAAGLPCCYRFRVPKDKDISINDIVRGQVTWNTDTLGDFVILRSSGLPVYNFCVAIDDALMEISHVVRAEEHLPNTLRQVLIYNALGFQTPTFAHVSLILAPDKSKLSKRHGATSVGEFREQGYLAPAMINYLSLLGWNDGTEKEVFTVEELQSAFGLERITKSAAVFDKVKLGWMNGQHLKGLSDEEYGEVVGGHLVAAGVLKSADSAFAKEVLKMIKTQVEVLTDAPGEVRTLLGYDLQGTVSGEGAKAVMEDNFAEVVAAVLAAWDSGAISAAAGSPDGYKKWVNSIGKAQKRKGKRLFMPMRVAFTGRMQGPDVAEQLAALVLEQGDVVDTSAYVPLTQRMETLRSWLASQPAAAPTAAAEAA